MKRITIVVYSSQKKKKIALSAQVDCLRDTRQLETPDNIIKSFEVKNKGNEEQQNI